MTFFASTPAPVASIGFNIFGKRFVSGYVHLDNSFESKHWLLFFSTPLNFNSSRKHAHITHITCTYHKKWHFRFLRAFYFRYLWIGDKFVGAWYFGDYYCDKTRRKGMFSRFCVIAQCTRISGRINVFVGRLSLMHNNLSTRFDRFLLHWTNIGRGGGGNCNHQRLARI